MLRLFILALFTFFYLSAALATPNFNFATPAMAEDAPFRVNYGPNDYEYGRDIDLLSTELGKNQLKKKTVDALGKYQQRTHSFSILNSTYDLVQSI